MKIQKQYNNLFKTLSRLFGVRRAKRLLQQLINADTKPINTQCVSGSFVWSQSTGKAYCNQAVSFWAKANRNAKKRIKGY